MFSITMDFPELWKKSYVGIYMVNIKASRWCFTINNYDEDDINRVIALGCSEKTKYMIFGFEKGEQGTPHIQGYVYFDRGTRTFKTMQKLLIGAHIEVAKGSPESNKDYCSKEGEFFELGELTKQGQRTDIEQLKEDMNLPMDEIMQRHFGSFLRYNRGIKEAKYVMQKHRTVKPIVYWVYGPTGVGKTHFAIKLGSSYYIKNNTKWWDGYEQEEVIILDDFDAKWPFRDLLMLLQEYRYQGQTKGGHVKINSKYIVITCDRPPGELYNQLEEHELSQLLRRIDHVKKLERCVKI